jgi:hypothetical protein
VAEEGSGSGGRRRKDLGGVRGATEDVGGGQWSGIVARGEIVVRWGRR